MLTNEREKKICEKYSKRDANGLVHCLECPLNKSEYRYDYRCKAICHYDKHLRKWVYDGYWKNYDELTDEEMKSGLYCIRATDRQRIYLYYEYLKATGKGDIKTTPADADFMNGMESWYLQIANSAITALKALKRRKKREG